MLPLRTPAPGLCVPLIRLAPEEPEDPVALSPSSRVKWVAWSETVAERSRVLVLVPSFSQWSFPFPNVLSLISFDPLRSQLLVPQINKVHEVGLRLREPEGLWCFIGTGARGGTILRCDRPSRQCFFVVLFRVGLPPGDLREHGKRG